MKVLNLPANGLKIMISGPMTGLPDFNRPLFNEVAQELRYNGFTVYNPATLPEGWSHAQYMEAILQWTDEVDALYMLEGWEHSKGAVLEFDRVLLTRVPMFKFHSLNAFRAALERNQKLRHAIAIDGGLTEGHKHVDS